MNKVQNAAIAEYLTSMLQKLERLEEKTYTAKETGDDLRAEVYGTAANKAAAQLEGAERILNMLGYCRRYHDNGENGFYTVDKI